MRAGAKYILGIAKQLAPKDTGALAKALKVRAGKRKKDHIRINIVSAKNQGSNMNSGDMYYGAFVEYGTSHMPAQSFLRNSFDRGHNHAASLIKASIIEALNRLKK